MKLVHEDLRFFDKKEAAVTLNGKALKWADGSPVRPEQICTGQCFDVDKNGIVSLPTDRFSQSR